MKNKFYLLTAIAFSVASISLTTLTRKERIMKEAYKDSHLKNSNGAPNKKTGAPGEGSCVDCHSGTVNDGTSINNLVMVEDGTSNVVTQYTPGQTYMLTLAINTASTKKGFQTVALDGTNTQAGTMTAVAGSTATATFQGRTYVNHTTASNTAPTFSFKWTAPSTNVGNVKFYLASNATNNNSSTSGDLIYLSQHTFSPAAVTAPTASFTSSATQICAGSTITYTSTSTGNPSSISWSFPGGNPATSNATNPTVTYSTAGNYTTTLSATNSGGTTTSNSSITVQNGATLALGTVSNTSACGASDGSVQITGSGSGTISWTGTASGSMSAVALPATVTNLAAGSYSFTFNNGTTCPSNAISATVNDAGAPAAPTVSSSDADNILCSGTSLTLTSSASTGILWSTGDTSPTITVSTAGDYFVTFTQNGCSATSSVTTVSVVSCAGIDQNTKNIVIIYPNPTMDVLTVKNLDINNFSKIQLLDLQGKLIQSWNINAELENINLEHINKGSYLIKIVGKTNSITKALTKF